MKFEQQLKLMLSAEPFLMALLKQLSVIAPDAYLCAGVIRNWVWSLLHGQSYCFQASDIDVIYFDAEEKSNHRSLQIQQQLQHYSTQLTWDVTNQAHVHRWYHQAYATQNREALRAFRSLEEAISTWPETATAIAIRLNQNQQIDIIAPFGLDDLFHLKLRWNDRLVPRGVFEKRIQSKRFLEQWPKLELLN